MWTSYNGEDCDGVASKRAIEEDTSSNAGQDKLSHSSDGTSWRSFKTGNGRRNKQ